VCLPTCKMKTAYITIILCLLAAVSASSQERPRYSFDNFDTSRGVSVNNPTFVPVGARKKPAAVAAKGSSNKKLLQPTAQVHPVKQTPLTRMGVAEGLADRETERPSTFNNNFK